jgi:hypothetical protein
VGTAEDPHHQLFKVHGFKDTGLGLIRNATSSSDAAPIADLLIGRGLRGSRGEKARARSIYVFKLNKHTTPSATTMIGKGRWGQDYYWLLEAAIRSLPVPAFGGGPVAASASELNAYTPGVPGQ